MLGLGEGQAYLIKVPKFVASEWRQMDDGSPLATLNIETGNIKGINVVVNGEKRILLCKSNDLPRAKIFVSSDSNSKIIEFAQIASYYTFYPPIDDKYRMELKQRHIKDNVTRDRHITEEKRPEPAFASVQTLFKFYNPKAGIQVLDSGLSEAPFDRAKSKFKRHEKPDQDAIKMKIFKLFESETGANGLQLKQIALHIGESIVTTKTLVEDIAQLKRSRDRKMLYFLKDQFNPSVTLDNELPFGKK